ncbi:hypothetical protein FUAX_27190 [Fulvitalea axinellae]|uniref:ABC transporter domain-containing protein n=1 Tax=Fulvitalea axinellae TaxID=1182444 RepID=A0AAU9CQP3_9BACT|nr:hypothetical protein FUAX_27190 [Fulvitalea axinellae]
MSEEILKALTRLFAIITKQDGGVTEREREYVISFFEQELDQDTVKEYLSLYDELSGFVQEKEPVIAGTEEDGCVVKKKRRRASMSDSVKTLAICRKINKTLTQKQKVVVLAKLLELVASDRNLTRTRMEIIDTVADVFNISPEDYRLVSDFVLYDGGDWPEDPGILIVASERKEGAEATKYFRSELTGEILFMHVPVVEMYFVKNHGTNPMSLNGQPMQPGGVYLFSHGATIKASEGTALYYSDLVGQFHSSRTETPLSFNADIEEFRFPNGGVGLRNIRISEGPGNLIGIMGGSGTGKTTLLNVLAGLEKPGKGQIRINGIDINTPQGKHDTQGVIGYVSQDDLLIEELSVYQNLYYNAKLCFADLQHEELHERVIAVLTSLGLEHRKDLRVGNVLDKTISGGQRKRLNIALELIREPAVMFVDEPTSGLSSRDSENVIDLLKELSLKGKLIFVVIHQPSSDIYKMFDKMFILDTGGFPIYYGHPIEAVTYFKRQSNQVDADRGQCVTCGNVNPEQVFNIIEAKVVDEYGELTNKRKVTPIQWAERFQGDYEAIDKIPDVEEKPQNTLKIPPVFRQAMIFAKRDFLSKISNKQYLLINLLQAPVLAFILSFIIRYNNNSEQTEYLFRYNENIPVYIMMAVIVALFFGLTVSAEEIIRDRKILKRESFLNLSRNSYLMSKIGILFTLSAIQTLMFVVVGNVMLEVKDMGLTYWSVLFAVSCFANILGLNVSSAFNSAVTVYILIPLLIIPQMVLSGLLFRFDKLNDFISTKGEVPVVADIMVSRWAYEAVAVDQFKSNPFTEPFFKFESQMRNADFKASYYVNELRSELDYVSKNIGSTDSDSRENVDRYLKILGYELEKEPYKVGLKWFDSQKHLTRDGFSADVYEKLDVYLDNLKSHYLDEFNLANRKVDLLVQYMTENRQEGYNINELKNTYYNESLADLLRNVSVKQRIIRFDGRLVRQIDPIYEEPEKPTSPLNYRTHFFSATKYFAGMQIDTFRFNLAVIWLFCILLYVTLYYEALRKIVDWISNIKLGRKK